MRNAIILAVLCVPLLGGCIKGVFPDPEAEAKRVEDEAAATGMGCRQAGRSLEDCYVRNESLNRNGAVRGWREMDEYMRLNKIEPQPASKELKDKEAVLKEGSKEGPREPAKESQESKKSDGAGERPAH